MELNNKYIFDGLFGLERETLRVTSDGALAKTPHPFPGNSHLDRDFCENQLELITLPCESIQQLMLSLKKSDRLACDKIYERDEYLWLYSNPPHINLEEDIPVADFGGSQAFKRNYRDKLERRYGKRLMLYSGIHFNFSFSEDLIKSIWDGDEYYDEFKTNLYFRLSKQVLRYSWLLVLLTSASPDYDLSFGGDGRSGSGFDKKASMRNSERGYWNQFLPVLDYTNLHTYMKSVDDYIKKGALFSTGELYLPVRLKPDAGRTLEDGINHIELRMFDLNPLYPMGISADDLNFTHFFILYLINLPDFVFTPELQETAVKNHKAAAGYNLDEITINGYTAKAAAIGLLDDMEIYFSEFPIVCENIEKQKRKLICDKRYSTIIHNMLNDNFQKKMLELIKNRRADECANC